ncbi:MAG: hypothetical protein IJW21_08110 [Clostridia bacterium]|nr:hypothetical protein [Clostridia bacterium]
MKNKFTVALALFLCVCTLLCSCAEDVSALENLCFAVRGFELEEAAKYVYDGEGYFAGVLSLAGELSGEKAELAKLIYSKMEFSGFEEDGGVCTFTVKYVDFSALIAAVNVDASAGASATESLRGIVESGRLQKQFMKTKNSVKVTLRKDEGGALVPLGYAGENAELTGILGLDTFLRWYSLQR